MVFSKTWKKVETILGQKEQPWEVRSDRLSREKAHTCLQTQHKGLAQQEDHFESEANLIHIVSFWPAWA
jgi:hypothetical protein